MLECINVSCYRGERRLFNNLSFSANKGSVTIITGGNGSGKTTLLRAIIGFFPIRSGSIKFHNCPIKLSDSYTSQVTYIGHKNACNDTFTVLENLKFWAALKDTQELVEAAVCFLGINQVLDIQYKNLSAGWKRKVALSRLLIYNTLIWVIDEPFTNLDHNSIQLITELISIRQKQNGIIIVADNKANINFTPCQIINIESFF
ncbi:heme ABC exporter ATP-binding protein CcmA [Neoehrlichia mikurensis]|uniref:Heme ABC exporter ATP-binding protein CcmA n=1 Tax=Neoehrlichia mikurensis TaxID=89586 RepID=A0A9Q9F3S8_9RICK|nr:heme ABC exporter ATP-binding protein CcmA [Neoehrlichia mikurensis]QXK91704.1 heme ABC exporter ATP-binding protein CcmA [Neoehrlichia mikurensis]QXK92916.1 heme ABC exporter ATP-binding protein CcmA [Neoehrlichia mikurensis]QXK93395.1 heme ABC exporter ATP-binding protein CcmA [Neoehrlichia mikurensis]UTO55655.1 heme ABC exporter ATP-binding protein CcmA [Neoehrlichia mikurensis]UTO56576.1 heme ABC exporter ATP-binding protein CcmA [Neoehrlichia mikurensis]